MKPKRLCHYSPILLPKSIKEKLEILQVVVLEARSQYIMGLRWELDLNPNATSLLQPKLEV